MENTPVNVSAILPAHKRIAQTLETIRRLKVCQPLPDEILVHVDAGGDECRKAIEREHSDVKLIGSQTSVGPGGARNKLIAAARNELVASFDDDSFPMDVDYFSRVTAVAAKFPAAAILSTTIYQQGEAIEPATEAAEWVADFIGCGCVYRKSVFMKTSGYVPLVVAYEMEEVDIALRLLDCNNRILKSFWLRVFHDTRLQHHTRANIVAASIANRALLTFLRYPLSMWPVGAVQCLDRVRYLATQGRINGILQGIGMIPAHIWCRRQWRHPVSRATVSSFLKLRRRPVRLEPLS